MFKFTGILLFCNFLILAMPLYAETGESSSQLLNLDSAVKKTLEANPELLAVYEDVLAQDYLLDQSKVMPNPELEIGTENLGINEVEIVANQLVELGNKRENRMKIAETGKESVNLEYEKLCYEKIALVAEYYLDILESQQKAELILKAMELSEKTIESIQMRITIGALPKVELTRALVAHTQLKLEHKQELLSIKAKKELLAGLWNGTWQDVPDVAPLNTPISLPSLSEMEKFLENNYDLQLVDHEIELQKLEVLAERAEAVPDLSLGAGMLYNNEENETAAVLTFAMDLKLFDKNQGNISYALSRVKMLEKKKYSLRQALRTTTHSLYYQLEANMEELLILKNEVLPGAGKAYTEVEEMYTRGKLSLIDLLDARQTVLEVNFSILDAEILFRKTEIALKTLVNSPITKKI